MDITSIENSVNRYKDAVLSKFSPKAIILFGSYANGNAHDDSDIDIAVVFDRYTQKHLDAMQDLFVLTQNVDMRIEPILLEEANDKSGFLRHVKQTGKVIYEAGR